MISRKGNRWDFSNVLICERIFCCCCCCSCCSSMDISLRLLRTSRAWRRLGFFSFTRQISTCFSISSGGEACPCPCPFFFDLSTSFALLSCAIALCFHSSTYQMPNYESSVHHRRKGKMEFYLCACVLRSNVFTHDWRNGI